MNQKQLQTKYAYLLDDASLLPAEEEEVKETSVNEEVKTEIIPETNKEEPKQIKEGFDTHVLCNNCSSGNLQLSKKKTKIRCKDCGNVGLTESVVGLTNKRVV